MQYTGVDYFQRKQAWRTGMSLRLRLLERWAKSHALLSPTNAERLTGMLKRLETDTLSIAFVGDISRGKSELITALFFGTSAHRLLPVGPGRTTLCPTDIRFQAQLPPSLRLLPIETAADPRPLSAWHDEPAAWMHVDLALDDAQGVAKELRRITWMQEQEVATTQQTTILPPAAVARWRYAMVNLAHPLLAQGLRILDLPGLNAVGAEPQHVLGLLASCDVLVFVLSAETGLSASDLALWQEHLVQGAGAGCDCLVVLNKADAWWDPQQDATAIDQQLHQQRMDLAAALAVAPERVVSVSARAALAAQPSGDAALLARSGLSKLEDALWKNLLVQRHQRCQADLAHALACCKADIEQALLARSQKLQQPKERLKIQVIESTLVGLLEKIRRTLEMPELDTTIATLDRSLRQSVGASSVRHAYEQAQKDIRAQWKRVDQWAGEMGHMRSASEATAYGESADPHRPTAPLHLEPYEELLQQAFDGHLQFLGNSQVHRLKQADFTGKLLTALRARIAQISQQMSHECETWHAQAGQALGHRLPPSQRANLQGPQEDKLNQLHQTLNAYFLALTETNAYE